MTTTVRTNGSHWAGTPPDPIENLFDMLAREPLEPIWAPYVQLAPLLRYTDGRPIYPEAPGTLRVSGNFAHYSHAFEIDTDEPEVIERLQDAIAANLARWPDVQTHHWGPITERPVSA